MATPIDTEYWKLGAWLDFKPTDKNKPITIKCDYCGGRGKVGGGFKSIDGPQDCTTCFGTGGWADYSAIPAKPAMPPELIEHMRKALFQYFKENGHES